MGILSHLLDLIFPPRCVFCRKFVKSSAEIVCPKCVADLPYTANGGKQSGDFFKVCVAPLYYEGDVRESFHRFKFREAIGYAKTYGKFLAECIAENLNGEYDIITWVPISRKRYKERGYDQSMLIAQAAALCLDDVAVSLLEKHRDVEKQSKMGSAEKRRANISGAYRVTETELVAGKRILLIDDIITTGSTISECAKTLKREGAAEVVCACIARSRD